MRDLKYHIHLTLFTSFKISFVHCVDKLDIMKKLLFFLLLVPMVSFGQTKDSINQYKALRLKNELAFQKSYRVLKTTFKSLEGFQTFYPGTKITLEKILRYHFYTAIHINQKENKLFSMDLTEFKLKNNTSEEEITQEIVALIGDMFYGSNELKRIPIKN